MLWKCMSSFFKRYFLKPSSIQILASSTSQICGKSWLAALALENKNFGLISSDSEFRSSVFEIQALKNKAVKIWRKFPIIISSRLLTLQNCLFDDIHLYILVRLSGGCPGGICQELVGDAGAETLSLHNATGFKITVVPVWDRRPPHTVYRSLQLALLVIYELQPLPHLYLPTPFIFSCCVKMFFFFRWYQDWS